MAHHLRCLPNIEPALGERAMFAGNITLHCHRKCISQQTRYIATTLVQCGPPSATLVQQCTNIVSMYRACWDIAMYTATVGPS